MRKEAMKILQEEASLQEIVQLVGLDAVSPQDRLTLEIARMIREDFLGQNSFDEIDTYTSLEKQKRMLILILTAYHQLQEMIAKGMDLEEMMALPFIAKIGKAKLIPEQEVIQKFDEIEKEMQEQIVNLEEKGAKTI